MPHLRWQAIRKRPHSLRLQHPVLDTCSTFHGDKQIFLVSTASFGMSSQITALIAEMNSAWSYGCYFNNESWLYVIVISLNDVQVIMSIKTSSSTLCQFGNLNLCTLISKNAKSKGYLLPLVLPKSEKGKVKPISLSTFLSKIWYPRWLKHQLMIVSVANVHSVRPCINNRQVKASDSCYWVIYE